MGDCLLTIVKIILAILLLPLVIAAITVFHQHIGLVMSNVNQQLFLLGIEAFLIVFLFIYQFWGVYDVGQKIIAGIFRFLAPFDRFFSYLLPFYVLAAFLFFIATVRFLNLDGSAPYFMFFIGFAFAMHILLTAQELQQADKTSIKISYLFAMSLIVLANIVVMVLLLDVIEGKFATSRFFTALTAEAKANYAFSFKKLFLFK